MIKTIKLKNAIGHKLAHDITEIRAGKFKGPAFRKGHTICDNDICTLQHLGKNHLYMIDLEADEIDENEAAVILAEALAGEGIIYEDDPKEGKISLLADNDGLFSVDVSALAEFNRIEEVMCATIHNHTLVKKGERVAATRAIPLVMKRARVEQAAKIADSNGKTVSVRPLRNANAGLVITGNEIYHGLVEDHFSAVLTHKISKLGSIVTGMEVVPDNPTAISLAIRSHLDKRCDLILLSGGMSVDPDDVTRNGICQAGAEETYYGAAALPGAMFLVAYIDDVPLLGVPACALYHPVTVLDLVLPRILAGEKIKAKELAGLGHGGLCRECPECRHPHCPFGKGT